MVFGEILGQATFANPVAIVQFVPVPWDEICKATVGVKPSNSNEIINAEQVWITELPSRLGSIIRRC